MTREKRCLNNDLSLNFFWDGNWQTEVLTSSIVLKIGNDNKLVVITSVEVWVSRVFYISSNPAGLGQDREFSSLFPFYYEGHILLLFLIFDKR